MAKTLKRFTPYDLLEIALKSAENNIINSQQFKEFFDVDFTFLQLCQSLTKKKIWNKIVLTKEEYGIIKDNLYDKERIIKLLKEVKQRNTITIANFEQKN